ncbi:MAG: cytochrome c-type biogenesis protein CcmH [Candidatus Rokubacteria bacterium]|nr:cytochrome c-type biogenesis protein CcmH [Candidatus Rokubacteria bacterium]
MSTARSSSGVLRVALATLLLLVLLPSLAASVEDDLERRMREVASGLRCPVCQNLSVADSTSEMAREMRALIADELRAGKSPEQIRAYFVEKYGQWILLSPTARGFGLLVWLLPALAGAGGLGAAVWVIRRWARRSAPAERPPVDETRAARLRALVASDEVPGNLSAEERRTIETLRELAFDHQAGKLSDADYEELRALYESRAIDVATSSARARAERRLAELEAALAAFDAEAASPAPSSRATRPRTWRWVAGGVFLLGFSVALGVFLTTAIQVRGDGSITGGALTGTGSETALAASRDVHALLAAGEQAMQAQDYTRASAVFRRVLELDASEPTAHAFLGLILLRAGHTEQALGSFERALEKDPISAPALWGKGLVLYESLGRPAEALHVWQTLLALKISDEDRKHVTSVMDEARRRLEGPPRAAAKPVAGPDR